MDGYLTTLSPSFTAAAALAPEKERLIVLERVEIKVKIEIGSRAVRWISPGNCPFSVHLMGHAVQSRLQLVASDSGNSDQR
jgi:hypothetical protein